jgi:CRP-like cAMP-binding protein
MNLLEQLIEILEPHWEDTITLKRNDYLVSQGDISTKIYLVIDGSLRVFIEDDIEEHTIRFGYKNSIITALDSFLTETPTSFHIQAIKKCTLKVISKKAYDSLINSTKENQYLWKQMLEGFVYQQIEREIDLITDNPEKRFQRVFKRSTHVFQEIPQKYIASYLRMTPETLSRILKNLD